MKMDVEIDGIEDIQKMFEAVAPRQAKNIMRATVHGIAGELRNEAKKNMPTDTSLLKKSTKAKRRKEQDNVIRSDVMVEQAAYYWRFLEYGQGPDGVAHGMFKQAITSYKANAQANFLNTFVKKLEASLKRAAK